LLTWSFFFYINFSELSDVHKQSKLVAEIKKNEIANEITLRATYLTESIAAHIESIFTTRSSKSCVLSDTRCIDVTQGIQQQISNRKCSRHRHTSTSAAISIIVRRYNTLLFLRLNYAQCLRLDAKVCQTDKQLRTDAQLTVQATLRLALMCVARQKIMIDLFLPIA